MENLFLDIAKQSPTIGILLIFWYFQRLDYKSFVDKVQTENYKREENMNKVIAENQEIIRSLSLKFDVVEEIKCDVEEIKNKIK